MDKATLKELVNMHKDFVNKTKKLLGEDYLKSAGIVSLMHVHEEGTAIAIEGDKTSILNAMANAMTYEEYRRLHTLATQRVITSMQNLPKS